MKLFLFPLLMFCFTISFGQSIVLQGKVSNEQNEPLAGALIHAGKQLAVTGQSGEFHIKLPEKITEIEVELSGYQSQKIAVNSTEIPLRVILQKGSKILSEVNISSARKQAGMVEINKNDLESFASASGNFESFLKTLPGVSSNNELSSQYSVRGGNFDENLVYINDVEIIKPLLVRNGQQEGLSFINPELISQAQFSAGGFEAKYGDKLSSVLDVRYGRPDSAEKIVSASLIGMSATIKIPQKSGYLLLGARNKTNGSVLSSQQVKGNYQPGFYDFQLLLDKNISPKLSLSLLGGYNLAQLRLIPGHRETTFGTYNETAELNVKYEGGETDRFRSLWGGITLAFKPSQNLQFKWINSVFSNDEKEDFDIQGNYVFNAGDSVSSGYDLNYGKNRLNARILSSELRAGWQKNRSFWQWGFRLEHQQIVDSLYEYHLTDTVQNTDDSTPGNDLINSFHTLPVNELSSFLQNTISLSGKFSLNAGIRFNYNSYTKEFLTSPRVSLLFKSSENLFMHFSAGVYNQPPFYREMRNYDGSLNPLSRAQRSLHFLAGSDYSFQAGEKMLKFSSELYYKKLERLIPYKIENLRVRYFADEQSKGYAAGADFSLSGEFVKDLSSSFRLSLMKTAEDIIGDSYLKKNERGNITQVEPGFLPRPTDQRVNFSAFFQDKFLQDPSYKVHLTLLYGSALPVGPPETERYNDVFRIPAYKRADIGFSKELIAPAVKSDFLHRNFSSLLLYAEIFNLLNVNNTVSYLWLKDAAENLYAIPDYLTSRQLNLKIIAKFK